MTYENKEAVALRALEKACESLLALVDKIKDLHIIPEPWNSEINKEAVDAKVLAERYLEESAAALASKSLA